MTPFWALSFFALVALATALPIQEERDWRACKVLPVLNETCVEVFLDDTKLSAGLRLIVNNRTVFEKGISAGHLCLDDTELLKLIELIPVLAPYKSLIDEILKVRKFIPADVFSVCANIPDLHVKPPHLSGCVYLDIVLMCWQQKCLWRDTVKMGCFNI